MVSGFRGYLNYANGEYKVLAESTGSASISLTEDNIIGGIKVSSLSRNSRYNRVIVTLLILIKLSSRRNTMATCR